MLFAKVKKEVAEEARMELARSGTFSKEYKIIRDGRFVYFPVGKKISGFDYVELEAERFGRHSLKLQDLLKSFLSESEREQVVTSFDVLGSLAIIEIPKPLIPKEGQIARAILKVHRNLKTVAKKTGAMSGEYRVRPLKVIAGEERTETLYKENGVRMLLDPSTVYFSVRLSNERKRIASLVKEGENVLVLFAGVGPFALVIAKSHPDAEIVAIELNPDAVHYMEENIRLNKFKNIKAVLGDARAVVLDKYVGWADRVTMPLPKSADAFLDVAIAGVKDGGIIHFYAFADSEDPFTQTRKTIEKEANLAGVGVEFLNERIVRPYAPRIVQVVMDFRVRKR